MRKNLLRIILISFLLIIVGYFLSQNLWKKVSSDPIEGTVAQSETTFSIVERGTDYLTASQKSTLTGQIIASSLFIDSMGQDLLRPGKKALIVFDQGQYKKYYPLLQEWARIYQEQMTVVLVINEKLTEVDQGRLVAAGIQPVFDSEELRRNLNPGPLNYSFLMDENRRIVYRYTFKEYLWREMVRDIDLFARQSVIPKEPRFDPIQWDRPLTLAGTLDGDKLFNIHDFKGKPSVFFLLNPDCVACENLYPLIHSLKARYNGRLNLGVIFSVYNYQTDQLIREFYDRYGLGHDNMENRYIENVKRFLQQRNLEEFSVFFDQNNRFFHQNLFWMTPTVMITDQNLKLVDIFGIAEQGEMALSTLEEEFMHIVNGIL